MKESWDSVFALFVGATEKVLIWFRSLFAEFIVNSALIRKDDELLFSFDIFSDIKDLLFEREVNCDGGEDGRESTRVYVLSLLTVLSRSIRGEVFIEVTVISVIFALG
jgi:hypothetical protein